MLNEFFSDALPFQFWLKGVPTYNESIELYRTPHKYFHKVNCDEPATLRFRDSVSGYQLKLTDDEAVSNILNFATTPEMYDNPPLSSYTNRNNFIPWTLGATPQVVLAGGQFSNRLEARVTNFDSGVYNFKWKFSVTAASAINCKISMALMDYTLHIIQTIDLATPTGAGIFSGVATYNVGIRPYYISIEVDNFGGTPFTATVQQFENITVKTYTHELIFTPADNGFFNKCGRLQLFQSENLPPLDKWYGLIGTWFISSSPSCNVPNSSSNTISSPLIGFLLRPVQINYNVGWIGAGNAECSIEFLKGGVSVGSATSANMPGTGTFSGSLSLTLTDTPDEVRFSAVNGNPSIFKQFVLNSLSVDHTTLISEDYTAQTDLLNFTSDVGDCQKITYKASKDFYLVPYNSGSGYFSILIPAQFSIKQFPTTQKEVQLTTKLIETAGSIREERLFQLVGEGLPDYMHKKLKAVFMHGIPGVVYIAGILWIMSNEYEEVHDRPDKFKPYIGKVWLTRKNYNVNVTI